MLSRSNVPILTVLQQQQFKIGAKLSHSRPVEKLPYHIGGFNKAHRFDVLLDGIFKVALFV
jgi:hypothetical protein